MSDWNETANAVRAMRVRARLRHYAPHPMAPTAEELNELNTRSLDELESDMFGKPAFGPLD